MKKPTHKQSMGHITPTLIIKLASIAIHAEELLSPHWDQLDKEAINGLLNDPEVRAFLADQENAPLLPLKRSTEQPKKRPVAGDPALHRQKRPLHRA